MARMSARVRSASRRRSGASAGARGSDGCAVTVSSTLDDTPSLGGAGGPARNVVPWELTHQLVHRRRTLVSSRSHSYLAGLIGSGIGPSLTPPLHEREGDELGLRYVYRRFDLDVLGLAPASVGDLLAAAR